MIPIPRFVVALATCCTVFVGPLAGLPLALEALSLPSGETTKIVSLGGLSTADNTGTFEATNDLTIAQQPGNVSIPVGQSATLQVVATSALPLSYQWYAGESGDDSRPVVGANAAVFTTPILNADASYWVRVSDADTTTASVAAAVSVVLGSGNGTIVWSALGDRSYGALGDGYVQHPCLQPIQVREDVAAVSAFWDRTLFLHPDGALWIAGGNLNLVAERERLLSDAAPVQIASEIVKAAPGGDHVFAVRADRTLWRIFSDFSTDQIADDVEDVAASWSGVLFVKGDGTLWGMGQNGFGQLGDGTTVDRHVPVQVAQNVSRVAMGFSHGLFVKEDNTLWAMGGNSSGQLGDGTTVDRHQPVQIANAVDWAVAGSSHSVFRKMDGTLWAMGSNDYGQLGDGTTIRRTSPVQIASGVTSGAAGIYHTLFVKNDGSLWGAGSNTFGALGDGTRLGQSQPVQVADGVVSVAAGQFHSLFVKTDGTAWGMGYNIAGQIGNGEIAYAFSLGQSADDVTAIVSQDRYSLFLRRDGSLLAAGDPSFIEINGYSAPSSGALRPIATGVVGMTVGEMHAAFVKSDGSLWTYGQNGWGQLGDGTATFRAAPIKVAEGISSVSAGSAHTAFVTLGGGLQTVGANFWGQLGMEDQTTPKLPVEVATDVVAVSSGRGHTMYLKTDGSVWGMGWNYVGQLGDGATTDRFHPVHIAEEVRGIHAADEFTVLLHTNGVLVGFGAENAGQFGHGVQDVHTRPVTIATDVVSASVGTGHVLYLKHGGTLWGLGYSGFGELGRIVDSYNLSPVRVAEGVVEVFGGSLRTFVLQEVLEPSIEAHPQSRVVDVGGTVSFAVQASSIGPLTYQWLKDGVSIPAANQSILTLTLVQPSASGRYSVAVSNLRGIMMSQTATLVVNTAPGIASGIAAEAIQATTATVSWTPSDDAQGDPVSYVYAVRAGAGAWSADATTTTTSVTLVSLTPSTAYSFRIRATDGRLSSETAEIEALFTTNPPDVAPSISHQPSPAKVYVGTDATFSIDASGRPTPTFHWQRLPAGSGQWQNLSDAGAYSGTATKTLTVNSVAFAMDGDQFRCVASNGLVPDAVSTAAELSVTPATVNVPAGPVRAGEALVLSGATTGITPSGYQWQKLVSDASTFSAGGGRAFDDTGTWVNIEGANGPTLTIPSAQSDSSGTYRLVVTAGGVEHVSPPVVVSVQTVTSPDARLMNLSTRALAQTGDSILIPGFVLGGSGTKRLLIRGVGPTLGGYGVNGTLADPAMRLVREGVTIASNDDWGTNANKAEIISAAASVGAFGLLDGSKDAAILVDLPAGRYTVPTEDAGGGSGVALVELYDADPASATTRLVNVSNRGFVDVGDKIMIPGFVVSNEGSRTFLIRAVGPTLAEYDVPDTLQDPRLAVYKRIAGNPPVDQLILTNDDWDGIAGSATTASVAAQIGAFPLAAGSKDAAFVVTLPPGVYTVHASGADETTGVALVEVYLVP